jgi:1-acyl-sn-glycerol-3-phosphate acyltransferase
MQLPNVGKSSILYNMVYWPVYLYYNIYYRSFRVTGRENVPVDKPIIYAGNHQNALMDALSVLFAAHGKVVFLARADMFRRKFIARLLFFCRIMPVYRIRDGVSSMGQNEATFEKSVEVLRNGTPLALFPEGNHAGFKRLRSLKKGICRIAFMAEEKAGFTLDLHIVPTGIDYSNYSDPGARLLVKYGKPIRVADYLEQYRENPQKALSALRDRLSEAMEPLIINISSEDNYDVYIGVCQMYRTEIMEAKNLRNTHYNRVETDREIVNRLNRQIPQHEELFMNLRDDFNTYTRILDENGLRDWLLQKNKSKAIHFLFDSLLTLLLLPLHLYGLVLNYLPYKLPLRFTSSVKDKVFHSSIHFGVGLVLFPFYYLLLQIIFSLFIKSFIARLMFAISLPLSGIITFYYYKHLLKLRGKYRLLRTKYTNKPAFSAYFKMRSDLINKIQQLIQFN